MSDKYTQLWLDHFSRIGFVLHHKQQIENAKRIQEHSMKNFTEELTRENPDPDLILKLKHDIRENIRLLTDLGLGTPIISAIKTRIDGKRVVST